MSPTGPRAGSWAAQCCVALLLSASGARSAAEWEVLFDGRDIRHWTAGVAKAGSPAPPFPADSWTVKDGWLEAIPTPIGASLYSRKQYRNFELEWEWRLNPSGNSGVKYRCRPEWLDPDFTQAVIPRARAAALGLAVTVLVAALLMRRLRGAQRWIIAGFGGLASLLLLAGSYLFWLTLSRLRARPPGLEYQLIDDSQVASAKGRTGAIYDLMAPPGLPPVALGVPHQSRIVVAGHRVEHWLDGRRILTAELGSLEFREAVATSKFRHLEGFAEPSAGYLQIQHHGTPAWFRNIRIRRLPE